MENKFWDADKIMSLAAMFISVCTLVVLIYQARMTQERQDMMREQQEMFRKQQMMSVYPYLDMYNSGTGGPHYELILENTGIGPAILKSVKVHANGNTYGDIVDYLDDTFTQEDSIQYGHSNLWVGRMISKGETVRPISLTDKKPSSGIKIAEAIFNPYVYIEIEYESIYGETWKISNLAHTPAKICDTCALDPFIYGYRSDSVHLIPIGDHSFMHVSYQPVEDSDDLKVVPYNGFIHLHKQEAIVFDTPVSKKGAKELIEWVENSLGAKIKAVVLSHFYSDRWEGLEAFHEAGIASYAHERTLKLAEEQGRMIPTNGFDSEQIVQIGGKEVVSSYWGKGCTEGNIVSHIPSDQLLIAGCLVNAMGEKKRELPTEEELEWVQTLKKVKAAYPKVENIIPSRGMPGGSNLVTYTLGLLAAEEKAP